MAVSVQKLREIVFQLLYSRAFEKSDQEAIVPLLMKQHAISRKAAREMAGKAASIWDAADQLDREIEKHAIDFSLDKIGMVERALLRQGIYGILSGELPPKVVITEAVRLSKKFSTPESGGFVNALLDAIYKEKGDAAIQTQPASV